MHESPQKFFISILVCLLAVQQVSARNYYLSSAGNDTRNTGVSTASPWKSIEKLNGQISVLSPGDSVFFRRGNIFKGSININSSGRAGSPVYFGAWGKGSKPVISGLERISGWKNVSRHIWEAVCQACGTEFTNFIVNGKRQPMGRWPNASAPNRGYLKVKWASGNNRLISPDIPDPGRWQDADLVIRTNRWVLERLPILSSKRDTITTSPTSYDIDKEFGFFISNHPLTLDRQGEWFFDKHTKKILLFSKTDPSKLMTEAAVEKALVRIEKQQFITIENLVFKGALHYAVSATGAGDIEIRNTEAVISGIDAIFFDHCNHTLFEKNKVGFANSSGLMFANCRNTLIRNNDVGNIGLVPGMGSGGSSYNYSGIAIYGASNLLENNRIDSVGYHGLRFDGDSMTVRNNVISNFCMVKDDGGGIYTWGEGNSTPEARRSIIGNVVFNGIGAAHGTDDTLRVSAEGIYVDDKCNNVDVIGNTIFKCGNVGIFIHNSSHVSIRDNVSYDNGIQFQLLSAGMPLFPIHHCEAKNNTFVARKANQRVATFITDKSWQDIGTMGTLDSNYYCRPADPEMIILSSYKSCQYDVNKTYSLEEWKQISGRDQHSAGAPLHFSYTIRRVFPERKLTYGFYNAGLDTWYPGETADSKTVAHLLGEGLKEGMNKWVIASTDCAFKPGESNRFLLRFEARGSKPGEIIKANFKTRDNQILYTREFRLDGQFRQNELLFIPTRRNEPFERVNFEFSDAESPAWVKNISFQEAEVTIPDPANHIFFVVNETGLPKTVLLGKKLIDVAGKSAGSFIKLKPYASAVFFIK
jgi:parallel beta-helix repeat protein